MVLPSQNGPWGWPPDENSLPLPLRRAKRGVTGGRELTPKKRERPKVGRPRKHDDEIGKTHSVWLYSEDDYNLRFLMEHFGEKKSQIFSRCLAHSVAAIRNAKIRARKESPPDEDD